MTNTNKVINDDDLNDDYEDDGGGVFINDDDDSNKYDDDDEDELKHSGGLSYKNGRINSRIFYQSWLEACPKIANQSDSKIELSTYERTNGTTVVIGCKGFGRHISGPTSVDCLETGAWSETPKLECKFGLDLREKVIVGAAAVSAALVILTIVCICCYCCCCRRRRYHRHHRYYDRRGSGDNWRDKWSGWTSQWFGGSGGDKDFKKSDHIFEYTSGPSKSFVNEFGYSRGEREKGNSFSKKSGFFRSSRRFSDGDKHSKNISEKFLDADKNSVHRQEFSKKSNFIQDSGKFSDIDKHSFQRKSNFLRQSGKYSDTDKMSLNRQDLSKRSNFSRQFGWHSEKNRYSDKNRHSDMNMFSGMFSDERVDGKRKGWRGWTDSLRENWIDWRSRTFGDSPADGSVRRQERGYDNFYSGKGFRGRFENGNRHAVMSSRRHSYDEIRPADDFRRGRRNSDSSFVGQQQEYTSREDEYGSRPDNVYYSRARRYSDPMVYRSEYGRHGQDLSRDSYKPSFNIIRYDDSRHSMVKSEPTSFEYANNSGVRYSGAETYRYLDTAQVLDPIYYTDPQHYHIGLRNSTTLDGPTRYSGETVINGQSQYVRTGGTILGGEARYTDGAILGGHTRYMDGAILGGHSRYIGGTNLGGHTRYSGGAIVDSKKLKYNSRHVNTDGLLRLPPISLTELSKVVDINGLNRSYSNRVASSPRIIELDGNKHVSKRVVGEDDYGRTDTGHFEMMKVNPSADFFLGAQEVPAENSTKTGGHYTLYQGKGRTKQFNNL